MNVHHIRYFGQLAEHTGRDEEPLELPGNYTVAELRAHLQQRHPALAGALYRVAVGTRLATDADPVPSGAEVALLPPFAGG